MFRHGAADEFEEAERDVVCAETDEQFLEYEIQETYEELFCKLLDHFSEQPNFIR